MSIATAIQNAQNKVAAAYDSVALKGGTLPATENLSNLPTAIESIPSGGGATVLAGASQETSSYQEDDKVLLLPSTDLYDKGSYTFTTTNSSNISTPLTNTPAYGVLDYRNGLNTPVYGVGSNATVYFLSLYWNDDYSAFANSSKITPAGSSTRFINVNYDGDFPWAARAQDQSSAKYLLYGNLGYLGSDGSFIAGWEYDRADWGDGLIQCIGPFAKVDSITYSWYTHYVDSNGSVQRIYSPNRNSFPSKYQGNWYIVDSSGAHPFSNPGTTAYGVSGFNSYTGTTYARSRFLDANGDYFWEYNTNASPSYWLFRKVNKNDTTWTFTDLRGVASEYLSCLRDYNESSGPDGWVMHSRDLGDTVESFMCGKTFGYDSNTGKGNKIAHFLFNKSTNTVTRLPDVFLDIPDTYTFCGGFQVNWDLNLIAVTVGYGNSSTQTFSIYVKKLNSLAQMYKYVAYSTDESNYTRSALTGFVTENQGADHMGTTVLEVATVEEPDSPPWSNIGIVYGMSIVVNEGVI